MAKRTGDPITLGSGKLYYEEFNNPAELTFGYVKSLCVPEKRLALIKSGAALEYSQETYTEKDDLGITSKTITTSEEVKLKCGLLTWTGDTLSVLVDRSKVTETARTETLKPRVAADGVQFFKIDKSVYPQDLTQYIGCWFTVNGQRGWIGGANVDTLNLFTDDTRTQPILITCEAGADIVIELDTARVTKIGGAGNAKNKYYVLVFHHEDKQDGDLWVAIVGRNTAGLSISFKNDEGSNIEPEFTAKPHDEDGTLVVLYEAL